MATRAWQWDTRKELLPSTRTLGSGSSIQSRNSLQTPRRIRTDIQKLEKNLVKVFSASLFRLPTRPTWSGYSSCTTIRLSTRPTFQAGPLMLILTWRLQRRDNTSKVLHFSTPLNSGIKLFQLIAFSIRPKPPTLPEAKSSRKYRFDSPKVFSRIFISLSFRYFFLRIV